LTNIDHQGFAPREDVRLWRAWEEEAPPHSPLVSKTPAELEEQDKLRKVAQQEA
jgi:hypothetical protein